MNRLLTSSHGISSKPNIGMTTHTKCPCWAVKVANLVMMTPSTGANNGPTNVKDIFINTEKEFWDNGSKPLRVEISEKYKLTAVFKESNGFAFQEQIVQMMVVRVKDQERQEKQQAADDSLKEATIADMVNKVIGGERSKLEYEFEMEEDKLIAEMINNVIDGERSKLEFEFRLEEDMLISEMVNQVIKVEESKLKNKLEIEEDISIYTMINEVLRKEKESLEYERQIQEDKMIAVLVGNIVYGENEKAENEFKIENRMIAYLIKNVKEELESKYRKYWRRDSMISQVEITQLRL